VLDRGAHGVLVPRVDDAQTAAEVAAAARYPGTGRRGMALGAIRASSYGFDAGYRAAAERDVLVAVQIESGAAVERALEIGRAPGVDIAFVGPNDLAAEMRMEGASNEPAFVKLVDATLAKLHAAGVPTGTIPHAGRDWRALAGAGVCLHVTGSDVVFMKDGLIALKRSTKEAVSPAGGGY
jgi:4-hydroxy-2-oxoheptanedioate aldolase